jgi:hypothetical protein
MSPYTRPLGVVTTCTKKMNSRKQLVIDGSINTPTADRSKQREVEVLSSNIPTFREVAILCLKDPRFRPLVLLVR